jgi:hypothetical protein
MRRDRVIRAEKRMDTAVIVVDVWKLQYYCKNGCKEQMTCSQVFLSLSREGCSNNLENPEIETFKILHPRVAVVIFRMTTSKCPSWQASPGFLRPSGFLPSLQA